MTKQKIKELFEKLAKIYGVHEDIRIRKLSDAFYVESDVFDRIQPYVDRGNMGDFHKVYRKWNPTFKSYLHSVLFYYYNSDYFDIQKKAEIKLNLYKKVDELTYAYLCIEMGQEKRIKRLIEFYTHMYMFNKTQAESLVEDAGYLDEEKVLKVVMAATKIGNFKVTKDTIGGYTKSSLAKVVCLYRNEKACFSHSALRVIVPVLNYVNKELNKERVADYF